MTCAFANKKKIHAEIKKVYPGCERKVKASFGCNWLIYCIGYSSETRVLRHSVNISKLEPINIRMIRLDGWTQ